MNARNTIFVHMICWNVMYSREVVDSMLKSVFMHDPYLQFIGMMKMLINHQRKFDLAYWFVMMTLSFKKIIKVKSF